MTINTRDKVFAGLAAPLGPSNLLKASQTAEGAGTWHSLWKAAGYPAAGANPPLFSAGAGYVPTKATTGAWPFTNASGGNTAHALLASLRSSTIGTIIVADRLWACSGLGTVITTAQAITTPGVLPAGRDPNGGGDVEPWLEVYTAPGATGATWTLTGTDSGGNAGRTWAYTHPANAESVGQMMPLMPGGGTPGLQGIDQATSFICSVSSGTAGDIGLSLIRRLCEIPCDLANVGQTLDAARLGLERIYDDACLMFIVQCSTTNTGQITGRLVLGQG